MPSGCGVSLTARFLASVCLALFLLGELVGCGGAPLERPPEVATLEPAPLRSGYPDKLLLEEALKGRVLSPPEVAGLSERLLADGNFALNDQETMARLERLLLKSLKDEDRVHRPVLLRNLGIIHYHQKKYKLASQELQQSAELNPRSARTHYYLALLYARQGEVYQRKGLKRKSRGQFKLADMEMGLARKFEPNNSLYRQDPRQILQQESGK